jgi:hypothetical protein
MSSREIRRVLPPSAKKLGERQSEFHRLRELVGFEPRYLPPSVQRLESNLKKTDYSV